MKIGPFEVVRAAHSPDDLATRRRRRPHTEIGASGTVNQSGFIVSDEYNPDLRGDKGLAMFKRMLRSDGTVREAYGHCVFPALNATWDIEPAGDDPLQLEQAEFGRKAFFEWPEDPFKSTLQLIFKYLAQGHQVFELPEKVIDAELRWTDPKTDAPVSSGVREFLVWDRWAHRIPETIWEWNVASGRLQSIKQRVWKDDGYQEPTTDAEYLAVFTNEKEGDDFTGLSIFRSAYKAWVFKELIEKVGAMSIELHGVGIKSVYVPKSMASDAALVDRIEDMLADMTAGERPYAVWPGPKGETSGSDAEGGYFFEIVSPDGGLPDFTPRLEYERGEIKAAMLARFSELGHGTTGARSTGETQAKVWYDALHAAADYVCGVMNERLTRLLEKNYPNLDEPPKLVARDIDARTLTEYADSVSKLAAAQLIRADKPARDAVRQAADLPPEAEDDPVHALLDNPDPQPPIEEDPTAPPGQ